MKDYLRKHLKNKNRNLKYDFLPSMLEIIDKPENKLSDFIVIIILLLIISAVVWAYFAKIDITVTAPGSINVTDNLVTVINAYGGEISDIYAYDGNYVKEGDSLFALNMDSEINQLNDLNYKLGVLETQLDVYRKIRDYVEPEERKDNLENSENIEESFGIYVDAYGEYSDIALGIVKEQQLFVINTKQFDLSRDKSDNKKLVDSQKESFIKEREMTVYKNIASLESSIEETKGKIAELERVKEEKIIKAPTSGQITNIQINSKGQVIASGQNIAYIVPEGKDLIFEAYVKSSDIDYIETGDEVNVKITAFNDTEYELIRGKVSETGNLALKMEGMGTVYKLKIVLEDIPQDMLKIGIDGNCDIIGGQRRVIEYFLEPFIKGLNNSLHEK